MRRSRTVHHGVMGVQLRHEAAQAHQHRGRELQWAVSWRQHLQPPVCLWVPVGFACALCCRYRWKHAIQFEALPLALRPAAWSLHVVLQRFCR